MSSGLGFSLLAPRKICRILVWLCPRSLASPSAIRTGLSSTCQSYAGFKGLLLLSWLDFGDWVYQGFSCWSFHFFFNKSSAGRADQSCPHPHQV
ncbi:hypothetical protein BaRGS_00023847 [Batillaria attramentaria]|uniref:Secreted protein n=1 Tax=Batillaria attramentaria TaxID=370345 RepID=A0ABD0KDB9_9CAEN